MEPSELAALKTLLLDLKAQALGEGDLEIEPVNKDAWERADTDDDLPLHEMNQVIASQRNKARKGSLERILAALQRLEEAPEDFGFCLECDEPIGMKRLELMPYATMCVRCLSERERASRRGGRRSLTDYD